MDGRRDLIQALLQRDLPGMGVRVPAETLRRFWTMPAPLQGQLSNASAPGQAPGGASHTTAARQLGTRVDKLMLRRLPPHQVNLDKRLVKPPKVHVRGSVESSAAPKPARGSWPSPKGLRIDRAWVIAPVERS